MTDYENYLNELKKYYNLKSKYEKIKENYKKKLLKSNDSMESKKKILSKQKFKCINCGNSGGTIFLENVEGFKATCGNIENPCNLNINIEKINTINVIDEIHTMQNLLEESKKKITLTKLDFLFKYIEEDNAVEKFEELKNELNINQEKYNKLLEYYYDITDNSEKKTLIEEKNSEFYNLILQYKELIELFKTNEDKKYLKEAISIYINKIMDLNKMLMEVKYKINIIETFGEENYLIQKKFENNDFNISSI